MLEWEKGKGTKLEKKNLSRYGFNGDDKKSGCVPRMLTNLKGWKVDLKFNF